MANFTFNWPVALLLLAAVCIVALTVPALVVLTKRQSRQAQQTHLHETTKIESLYTNIDGNATQKSIASFSNRWQRFSVLFLAIVALGVSITIAVVGTDHTSPVAHWINVATTACLTVQALVICTTYSPTLAHRLCLYSLGANICLLASIFVSNLNAIWRLAHTAFPKLSSALLLTQLTAILLQLICCISVPRRPNVYYAGRVVDQQYAVSLASRFTFTWIASLLKSVARAGTADLDELPQLSHSTRSHTLHESFKNFQKPRTLWRNLMRAHLSSLIFQHVLCIITCILSFGPQLALYQILKLLERQSDEPVAQYQAWIWCAVLTLVMVLNFTVDAWLWWIMFSELGIPVESELSALIFAKLLRCKNVTSRKKSCLVQYSHSDKTVNTEMNKNQSHSNQQQILNLTAVDTKRVADFAAFGFLILFSTIKLFISCAFLIFLIGWRSLLAGLAIAAILVPLNNFLARRYSAAQHHLMRASDDRIALLTEVLQSVRQIKYTATESQREEKVHEKRAIELKCLWRAACYNIAITSAWILGPLLLSATSLATYALLQGELSASVAFTALSIFGSLETALAILPDAITKGLDAKTSIDRIDKFMHLPERLQHTTGVEDISFRQAEITWPADLTSVSDSAQENSKTKDRFSLSKLNLRFPSSQLSVVTGKTGSGKSLLLSAVLGECDVNAGEVCIPEVPSPELRFDSQANAENWLIGSATAYVAQSPWIRNGTIRENILFGLPYDELRFKKAIFACRLEPDLEALPDGDSTDIGANGVNLSGGQKWRVCFARALYSRAGTLVLDDIFSALDAHTGRHVYEHGLTGTLGHNRTRILVTHHTALCLPRADYVVVLADGSAQYAGSVKAMKEQKDLTSLIFQAAGNQGDIDDGDEPTTHLQPSSHTANMDARDSKITASGPKIAPKLFSEPEGKSSGSILFSSSGTYFKRGKQIHLWALALVAYIAYTALIFSRSWWINVWTGASNNTSRSVIYHTILSAKLADHISHIQISKDLSFYLGVYIAISLASCVAGAVRLFVLILAALSSSRVMFRDLLHAVLRAPLRWLDINPLGRIQNRFTSDLRLMDSQLGYDLGNFLAKVLEFIAILAAGTLVSFPLAGIAVLLFLICFKISHTFLIGAREIKRLESLSRSPILELLGSTLAGLTTIRAYCKSEEFMNRMYVNIDRHAAASWNLWLLNRWLGWRLCMVGVMFSTATAALSIYLPSISAAMAGFAMSFALQYNFALAMALRHYANIEMSMNATERIIEYCNIPTEDQTGLDPPASWPAKGRMEVKDLQVAYAADLPPVLNGLTFTIESGQRVGVVGRTGAGKSSLALALFRFLETRRGTVHIDGIDTSKIKLHALRSRMAIITQDPVLFAGTVRSNLDPFDEFDDTYLIHALEQVGLMTTNPTTLASSSLLPPPNPNNTPQSSTTPTPTNQSLSLTTPISSAGTSLAQGQRQLLCLARALLSHAKILVLDEATSSVDAGTDATMQRCIRERFAGTTLLVIAHRLSTVVDFDRILVMDKGAVAEFGSPRELFEKGGFFRGLVDGSGERDGLVGVIMRGGMDGI